MQQRLFFLFTLAFFVLFPFQNVSAGPETVTRGDLMPPITWTVSNATECTTGFGSNVYPDTAGDGIFYAWADYAPTGSSGRLDFPVGTRVYAPGGSYTFTCTAGATTGSATLTVQDCPVATPWNSTTKTCQAPAPPAPTVSINPFSPSSITVGDSSVLSFSSTNTTSCAGTVGSLWASNLGGTSTPPGGMSTGAMSTAGTYTQAITCSGPGGSVTSETRTLTVTAPLPPVNNAPIGTFDAIDCNAAVGWTCDPDDFNDALRVDFYRGTGFTNPLGNTMASSYRADITSSCGGNGNHAFTFSIPVSMKDGTSHDVYAYAIDPDGGPFTALGNRSISCAAPVTQYSVIAVAGPGGAISPSGTTNYSAGATPTYTITPNSGYQIEQVTLDNTTNIGAVSSYTFSPLTSNRRIEVAFSIIPAAVPATPTGLTATPQACGTGNINLSWNSVSGATSYQLYDNSGAIAIYSGNGTSFNHTGLTASSSHSYQVRATNASGSSNLSTARAATAPATCPPPVGSAYIITATAGSNGSISPSGLVSVSSGSSQTFTFTPNPGYEVETYYIDSFNDYASVSSYTFPNVTSNRTIHVTFRLAGSLVEGVCNNAVVNGCVSGDLSDRDDTATHFRWACLGRNGGFGDATCNILRTSVFPGSCGSSRDTCSTGTVANSGETSTHYTWSCLGGGGGSSSFCSIAKVIAASLRICPTSSTRQVGQTQQFQAWYSGTGVAFGSCTSINPLSTNVTASATWSSTNSGVMSIDQGTGLATAESIGTATVRASYSGLTPGVSVNVIAPPCVAYTVADCTTNAAIVTESLGTCSSGSFTTSDNCSGTITCPGTRSCDYNWKEIAP